MKLLIFALLGIGLALFETVVNISFMNINLHIGIVALVALPLILTGFNRSGMVILFVGAIVLDIFSPFRMGLYLLSSVLAFAFVSYIQTKSLEITNPLIAAVILFISLGIFYSLELFIDPFIAVFLGNLVINALLATVMTQLFINYFSRLSQDMKVSDHVHFR